VQAQDKASGKAEKITITNDKGRLSKEEIERMVNDADAIEGKQKELEAKNGLENYCFQMKNTLNEEKLKDVFTEDEKKTVEECSKDGLQWLEGNADADADAWWWHAWRWNARRHGRSPRCRTNRRRR